MTTFNDLMGLAKRTLAGGDANLAGQISVLALDTFDDQMLDDGSDVDPQAEADQDAIDEKPLLEALEEGSETGGDHGYNGPQGETPIATVLEMAALAKRFKDAGHIKQARLMNETIRALSHSIQEPAFTVKVQSNVRRLGPNIRRRWALLCAKLLSDGKRDIAADVVGTLTLRRVQASEVKQFDLMSGDAPVLEELHEMLDELGYDSLMQMGEKRRKELENGKPGIWVPMQQGTM